MTQPPFSVAPFVADILVVDDMVANLQLLAEMLRREGYKVRPVPSGRLALQASRVKAPDLILLDVSMPEMDGYEVCRELKADPGLRDIPVVFLSAMSETLDKVRAFGCGAVDYITKPFQFEEVAVRVATHLRLFRAEKALVRQMVELRRLEELRDNLVHMVVHDMRGVLQAVVCSLDMLSPDTLPKDSRYLLDTAQLGATQLTRMVTNMLDIAKLEAGQLAIIPGWFDSAALMAEVTALMNGAYPERSVEVDAVAAPTQLWGDRSLINRVLQNLISNALSFTADGGYARVVIRRAQSGCEVRVIDQGPGISPERVVTVFDKFSGTERGRGSRLSHGLGLAFCKLAVTAHGGKIGVDSNVGVGSEFWFWLPEPAAPCGG